MKLCAIYIVWADWDLLMKSVDNIHPCVDGVIVIHSKKSNFGNEDQFYEGTAKDLHNFIDIDAHYGQEPLPELRPHENETRKRNYGLDKAKESGFTHFIMLDADEFYHPAEFLADRERVEREDLNGIVHPLKVLFKDPTLWCEDHTLVPGIQKLTPDLKLGNFKEYPFAYDAAGNAHIDPTRRPSHRDKVVMSNHHMIHASWIRKDINQKIENSAARNNLKRSSIYKDWEAAAPGVYNDFYRQTLKECLNYFNL